MQLKADVVTAAENWCAEVDSFVQKFKNLWESGFSAHLDLDTHSGQAWVGLRVQLEHHPPF